MQYTTGKKHIVEADLATEKKEHSWVHSEALLPERELGEPVSLLSDSAHGPPLS